MQVRYTRTGLTLTVRDEVAGYYTADAGWEQVDQPAPKDEPEAPKRRKKADQPEA